MTGHVTFVTRKQEWGFLCDRRGLQRIRFRKRDCDPTTWAHLRQGVRVTFVPVKNEKGPQALRVALVDPVRPVGRPRGV